MSERGKNLVAWAWLVLAAAATPIKAQSDTTTGRYPTPTVMEDVWLLRDSILTCARVTARTACLRRYTDALITLLGRPSLTMYVAGVRWPEPLVPAIGDTATVCAWVESPPGAPRVAGTPAVRVRRVTADSVSYVLRPTAPCVGTTPVTWASARMSVGGTVQAIPWPRRAAP